MAKRRYKKRKTIFLIVTTPYDAMRWAHDMWDTFGFDYDMESLTSRSVVVWPLESTTLSRLEADLRQEGIGTERMSVDEDAYFKLK